MVATVPSAGGGVNGEQSKTSAKLYDYFDRFLLDVEKYYASRDNFYPNSALQVAIKYQHGYFDYFRTFDNFIEQKLLQDFIDVNLWEISDFQELVDLVNKIIDKRGH